MPLLSFGPGTSPSALFAPAKFSAWQPETALAAHRFLPMNAALCAQAVFQLLELPHPTLPPEAELAFAHHEAGLAWRLSLPWIPPQSFNSSGHCIGQTCFLTTHWGKYNQTF
jgi:hypothetical protein